ncbi:SDR family oxidoreductase [Pigmentiphaga sp.]|uniref:SDR family oxidoreductase n=1 Tax=Pigmentiphaga sp. TaxID=1977564 RepID=UPI00128DE87E|nr:SDR family oxidoreductase [Pigmentiphaga sp.]MPS27130.1 SDR family oxidoreductase [Alcaligenaceae bacterium SAGV5]MPS51685.1 SDR family oxidoreductase [Alcaligenaceae bacterium SAGV3]MPT55849.1 SDR family oxidoreductase [Alcaligenaceae bacterium]
MDLQIRGRKAIVCASTRGLGRACAASLAREGVHVVINGRSPDSAAAAAQELAAETGGVVRAAAADINTDAGRAALVAACPDADILVTNNEGPAPGRFMDWEREHYLQAIEANMLAPAMLIRALLPGMRARGFGRIVNITSAMVKSPSPAMGLSTSARTGLTALCKAISREVVVDNVTINNLLPERFDTDRQRFMAERMVREQGLSYDEARQRIVDTIAAGRLGQPSEFGDACAFLCSAQAGYLSGQNLQLDGGSYRGVF